MNVMKNKKTKIFIAILIISLGLGGLFYYESICRTDGSTVCYDKNELSFKLEDQASIKVAVETEATKEHLETLWSELYPDALIEVSVIDALGRDELKEAIDYDVYYVNGDDAPYFMGQFANLGQTAQDVIASNIPIGLQDSYNINGLKFIPQNVIGKDLYLNTTLLAELDLNREDVASFEKIKENQDIILGQLDITFPFSFKVQDTFYPFLTAGGWTMNYIHDGMNPDFDSEKFLHGLEFIEFLQTTRLDNNEEKLPGLELPYNFESKFFERKSLFGYINDVELAQQYKDVSSDEWLPIPFPTYKEIPLSQQVSVNGYVVNSGTIVPSAAAEVLRLLRSPEFLGLGDDSRSPIMTQEVLDTLEDLDAGLLNRIQQFAAGDVPSILALEVNPSIRSMSFYTDVDLMEVLANVYDQSITPLEGQEKIMELAQEWLAQWMPEESEETE